MRYDLSCGLYIATCCFIFLLHQALPSLHWHDTAEFIANAQALGIAHPPGHPFTLISMHIAQMIPFFDVSMRSNLSCAFCISAAVFLMYQTVYTLYCEIHHQQYNTYPKSKDHLMIRLVAGLWSSTLCILPLTYLQGIRSEVYASQCALSTLCMYGYIIAYVHKDIRYLLIVAFSFALLSANHIFLAALLVIAYIPFLIFQRLKLSTWCHAIFVSLIGLQLYWYVYIRGDQGGLYAWGWVDDWHSFIQTVSAQVWREKVVERTQEIDWSLQGIKMLWFWITQLGMLATIVLTVINIWFIVRSLIHRSSIHRKSIHIFCFSCCVFLVLLTSKLSYPFIEVNPDFSGYLASATPFLLLGILLPVMYVAMPYTVGITLICFISIISQFQSSDRMSNYSAEAWGKALTEEVPTQGILWTSHYESHFIIQGLQVTQGWRLDLTEIFRGHRTESFVRLRLPVFAQQWSSYITHPLGMYHPLARIEVETQWDQSRKLWPYLRIQGLTFAYYPWDHHSIKKREDLQAKFLKVQQKNYAGFQSHLILSKTVYHDIDSAYHWALYFDAHVRLLRSQVKFYEKTELVLDHDLQGFLPLYESSKHRFLKHIQKQSWYF